MKNIIRYMLILSFVGTFIKAQNHILLKPSGEITKLKSSKDIREAIKVSKIKNFKSVEAESVFPKITNPPGVDDTLDYRIFGGDWNTDFAFYGQDVMLVWFEAITDMTIKGIGFTCANDEGSANATVIPRLIKLNWTKEQLMNFEVARYMV